MRDSVSRPFTRDAAVASVLLIFMGDNGENAESSNSEWFFAGGVDGEQSGARSPKISIFL